MQMAMEGTTAALTVPRERSMQVRDVIWLATLGAAARHPGSIEATVAMIGDIAGPLWPTAEHAVAACVREMLNGGHLTDAAGFNQWRITSHGLDCLERLMAVPLGGPRSVLGQVGLRLKLACLDLVSPEARQRVLAGMIADHLRDLALARVESGRIWVGRHGRAWHRADIERLERDLVRLRILLAEDGDGDLPSTQVRH